MRISDWSSDVCSSDLGADGIYMLLVDVSALKAAEDELFDESDRVRTALRAIADAVIVIDVAGHISSLNPTAESITGWSEDDALGRQIDDVVTIAASHAGGRVSCPVLTLLEQSQVTSLADDAVLVRVDESVLPISGSVASIHNAQGNVSGAVLVRLEEHTS